MLLEFLTEPLSGGLALQFSGLQHIESVDVPLVDIDFRLDSGQLEIPHVGERLRIEWLAVGNEGIAGR